MNKKIFFALFALFALCVSILPSKAQKEVDEQMRKLIISAITINDHYVDTVNLEKLVENAIRGMIEKLDPHSAYSTPEETKKLNEPLQGSFDGIGIQFNILDDTLLVVQTVTGGPSEKAGVMAGDRIISVNDTAIAGVKMPQEEIVKRLRGPRGTKAHLGILRDGIDETIFIDVVRDKIPLNSVDASFMVNEETGLIRFSNFAATTHKEVVEAIEKLKGMGMKNLIIDVTQNGGGYLQAAAEIASEFLPQGDMIVYTKGRAYPSQNFKSRGGNAFQEGKIIVLVDEYSASAAEILAGAIQDQDRGFVVGRRTFGKGLVQRPIDLPDGSMIRLTVARYYTPAGRCIQKPYESIEKYNADLIERYNRGEMMSADSIHFPDSLKCSTLKKGRTVYGGGGIMPDYFVPVDTTLFTKYHSQLSNKGVLLKVHFQLIDAHRDEWAKKYPDYATFNRKFELSDKMMKQLIAEGEKDGVKFDEEQYKKSESLIKLQLKALIARDLWDMNEYYHTINVVNESVNKALELLE